MNNFKELVYVIEQSNTIRKAIELFLRKDYNVFTFEDYQSFNEHIQKQTEIFPYVLLVEASSAGKINRKNNTIVAIAKEYENLSDLQDFVITKPFTKERLIEVVKKAEIHLKTATIIFHKETLEKELPINDCDEKKRIKV
jgi:FixJ family two-component response regulator